MCLDLLLDVDVFQAGDGRLQTLAVLTLFVEPQGLALFQALDLFFDALVGFLHSTYAHFFCGNGLLGAAIQFFDAFGSFAQQGDAQELFDDGTLIVGPQAQERFGVGVQGHDVAKHVMAQAQCALDLFLRFTAIALGIIGGGAFFLIDVELQHTGLASAFDAVVPVIDRKLQAHQHLTIVGLVDEIVAFDVGQCLTKQCIAQGIDNGGLAGTVARSVPA